MKIIFPVGGENCFLIDFFLSAVCNIHGNTQQWDPLKQMASAEGLLKQPCWFGLLMQFQLAF